MPIRPCRGTPERKPVTIGTSPGSSARSNPARISTFAERELVFATPRDASTTSANRVMRPCPPGSVERDDHVLLFVALVRDPVAPLALEAAIRPEQRHESGRRGLPDV